MEFNQIYIVLKLYDESHYYVIGIGFIVLLSRNTVTELTERRAWSITITLRK